MAEFSKDYSKGEAFKPDTYPTDLEFGTKLIKVGEESFWYDPNQEDEHSALPKKDIEALIGTTVTGVTGEVSLTTAVTVIDGVIKTKNRKLTFDNGVLKEISVETPWS